MKIHCGILIERLKNIETIKKLEWSSVFEQRVVDFLLGLGSGRGFLA